MYFKSTIRDAYVQLLFRARGRGSDTSQADEFTQLFQDDEFYKVVMEQLARAMYRKFKK